MPFAAILAASASICASLCGVFLALRGDFLSFSRGIKSSAPLLTSCAGSAATTSVTASPTLRISAVSAVASTASAVAPVTAFFCVLAIVPILSPLMPEACPRHASRGRVSARGWRGQMPASMAGLRGERDGSEQLARSRHCAGLRASGPAMRRRRLWGARGKVSLGSLRVGKAWPPPNRAKRAKLSLCSL
jgi:hypothetical protein